MNNKPSVLIASPFHHDLIITLNDRYNIDYKPVISDSETADIIDNYDSVIVATTPNLSYETLSRTSSLKLIIRMGIGIDHINIKACSEKGIILAITPNSNILPVVELVFSQLITTLRHLNRAAENLYKGNFRSGLITGSELHGKTIGVIGTGRIGSRICALAEFFGMQVLAYDPYIADRSNIKAEFTDMDTLLSSSDIITIHTPLTDETNGMINSDFLDKMKNKSILINTSRGKVAPLKELIEYSKKEKIEKFILDVYDNEPYKPSENDVELLKTHFVLTPHIGAYTDKSLLNRSEEAIREIDDFFYKKLLPHGIIDLKRGY